MATIVETIRVALAGAGFATSAASPGRVMPEITGPVAAVSLERVDTGLAELTVRAAVVSPVALGAQACEDSAMTVSRILRNMGGDCIQEACRFDAKTELFSVGVLAKFHGDVLAKNWMAGYGCSVKLGSVYVGHALSFTAWREPGEDDVPVWKFRLEEILDGQWTEAIPAEPFTAVVMAGSVMDTYVGCKVTSCQRILKDGYMRQIREGTMEYKQ